MLLLQAVAEAAPAAEDASLSLFDLLLEGGIMVPPILILLGLSIYLLTERLLYIRAVATADEKTVDSYIAMLEKGELAQAVARSKASSNALERVLYYGLSAVGNDLQDIERTMETASAIEISRMEKGIGYLGIIAGVAPMLGFIGTISGIIHIFYDISLSDNISIGVIAGGLYEKMISSGMGLVVGVIAYTFYHLLDMRIDRFTLALQERLLVFMNALQKS